MGVAKHKEMILCCYVRCWTDYCYVPPIVCVSVSICVYPCTSMFGSSTITVPLFLSHRTRPSYVVGTANIVQRLGFGGTMDRIGSRSTGCAWSLEVEGSVCARERRGLSASSTPSAPTTRSRRSGLSQWELRVPVLEFWNPLCLWWGLFWYRLSIWWLRWMLARTKTMSTHMCPIRSVTSNTNIRDCNAWAGM